MIVVPNSCVLCSVLRITNNTTLPSLYKCPLLPPLIHTIQHTRGGAAVDQLCGNNEYVIFSLSLPPPPLSYRVISWLNTYDMINEYVISSNKYFSDISSNR